MFGGWLNTIGHDLGFRPPVRPVRPVVNTVTPPQNNGWSVGRLFNDVTHNPVTNAASSVVRSAVHPFTTLGSGLIHTPQAIYREIQNKPITDIQNKVFGTSNSGKIARSIIGNTIGAGLTVAAPEAGRGISSATSRVVPGALGRVLGSGIAGGTIGAPMNVAATIASPGKLTKGSLLRSAGQGFEGGALLGGGAQAAGEVAKPLIRPVHAAGPESPVGKTPTPEPKPQTRGLTAGIKSSPEFSQSLQKSVSSSYEPFTNKAATMTTDQFMKQPLAQAKQEVMQSLPHYENAGGKVGQAFTGAFGKQEVANAGAVMKALDATGDVNGAQAIHDLLAQKLTNAGQTAQAASLIYNRTPEGLQNMAMRDLTNAGVKITPELKSKMDAGIAAIKSAPADSKEQLLAKGRFAQLVGKQIPTSNSNKLIALYKTGLLSSPETAVKVAIVNPITATLENIKDIPASAVDRAASLLTGKRTLVAPNPRNIAAGLHTAGTSGLQDAKTRLVENIAVPGSSGMGNYELSASTMSPSGANFGIKPNGERSLLDRATGGASSKALNAYTSSIGRVHGAIQTPIYEGRAAQSLTQSAQAEALNRGLSGEAKAQFIKDFMANPPKEAADAADLAAQYATSQQKTALGQAASGLQHNLGPVGQVIAPITRIPGAVATQLINYSPIGLAKTAGSAIADRVRGNPFDQLGFSQGMGRAIVGSGLMTGGAALAAQGRISGAYPTDKGVQALWQSANIPENSVYVGGHAFPGQPWRNYGGTWQQIGSPGGAGAQSLLTGAEALNGYRQGGLTGLLQRGAAGGAKIATNQPYLTGISGAMTAINTPDQAKSFYDQTAGSVVPNIIKDVAQATDPLQRQTSVQSPLTSMKNAITNGLPGIREGNQPQVDVFGNPIPRNGSTATALLNPFKPQANRPSDLITQLGLLHNQKDVNGKSLTIPTQIAKKYPITEPNGKKVALTDAQRTQFIESTGQNAQNELNQLIKSPIYQSSPPGEQSKMVAKVMSDQRAAGKAAVQTGQPASASTISTVTNPSAILSKAQLTNDKNSFTQSGKSFAVINGNVYQHDKAGNVTVTPQVTYNYDLGKQTLTQQKDAGNVTGWLQTAQNQLQLIGQQLVNPNLDPLQALTLQNEGSALSKGIGKYSGYGGFSKPKAIKAPKVKVGKKVSASSFKLKGVKSFGVKSSSLKVSIPRGGGLRTTRMKTYSTKGLRLRKGGF